jgi:HEAT repeat protein
VRMDAIKGLGLLKSQQALPLLINALWDKETGIRVAASEDLFFPAVFKRDSSSPTDCGISLSHR